MRVVSTMAIKTPGASWGRPLGHLLLLFFSFTALALCIYLLLFALASGLFAEGHGSQWFS
jgi:hypothetical protein